MAQEREHEPQGASAKRGLALLSDDDLVARARLGDLGAFEELVGRHEEKLYRLAMRLLRSETDAREILQETFLSAWRNLGTFHGKAQFGSWLYRVAANAALMLLRSRRRHPEVAVDDIAPEVLGAAATESGATLGAGADWSKRPDEHFHSEELRRTIQAAVDRLPEPQRNVFLLRDVDDLSTEETADLLQLSVPAVKTRLHRARLALRETITEYFQRS